MAAAAVPDRQAAFRLAKVVGVAAIMASAVTNEYGVTINLASVQSVSLYPRIEALAPWAMIAAGVLLLPKVLMFMRFSRVMPRAGSIYVWIGRTVGLPVGFVVSFLNWVSLTAAMGLVAFAFGTFLGQALVTAGLPAGAALTQPVGHVLLGLALIWGIYWVHASGVANYGKLVTLVFWLIVVVAIGIVAIGFTTSTGTFVQLAAHASAVHLVAPIAPPPPTFGAFIAVAGLFVAAYGGLNAAPSLGGEARDAGRTTPLGLIWGWLAAVLLYSAVLLALFHAVPWWSIVDLVKSKASALATVPGFIGLVAPRIVGVILGLVVALIVGKTLAPIMLVSSRSLFAWAEDGLIHARFTQTNAAKAPQAALFVSAALASLFLVQSTFVGWAIGLVIRSVVILLVMMFVGVGALLARYSKSLRSQSWARAVAEGWWVPWVAGLMIVIGGVLLVGVAVVPNTPLVFQPLFQGLIATLIGIAIFARAAARSAAEGTSLDAVARSLPLE